MTHQIISASEAHVANSRAHRPATWLTILTLLVIISLGCDLSSKASKPVQPTKSGKRGEFEKTDCSVAGITFPDITVSYNVDDPYDGGYLICNYSSQGAHGSVNYYNSVIAYKADKLDASYDELHANIQGFEDQANAWNADPNVPDDIKDYIFLSQFDDKYVLVISSDSNVQDCYRGYGYGVERYQDKYLIHLSFESCELADADAYKAVMVSLETAALKAIYRVEGIGLPPTRQP